MIQSASIIQSSTALEGLRALIAIRRSSDAKFSYSFLSKRLGIKSRSYLSEVFKGTKGLNPKHIPALVELLQLPLAESELLRSKLQLEFSDLNDTERDKLKLAIHIAEKKLNSGTVQLTQVSDINSVMLIAACFHLFAQGAATRREILDLFNRDKHQEIDNALGELLRHGLLLRDGDLYRYSPEYSQQLHLYMATTKKNEIDYLRSSLTEAEETVKTFDKTDPSQIFYSGLITTEMTAYLESLSDVKQHLRSIQSRIETSPSDTLIRFNVQIYPIVTKQKA